MTAEIVSGAALILVAVIEAVAAADRRSAKRSRSTAEQREADRARENRLAMTMMDASLDLALATAVAVEEGRLNGEMKNAREKAGRAQEEYRAFLHEVAAREVAKV